MSIKYNSIDIWGRRNSFVQICRDTSKWSFVRAANIPEEVYWAFQPGLSPISGSRSLKPESLWLALIAARLYIDSSHFV